MSYFIQVILPLPVGNLFSYRINEQEAQFLKEGMLVVVPFGKSKLYSAVVYSVYESDNQSSAIKDIVSIIDAKPLVNSVQIDFWQWIASYYMCSLGEVAKMALPKVFLLESETIIKKSSNQVDEKSLTDQQYLIYEALHYKSDITVKEASEILGKKSVITLLRTMIDDNIIEVSEQIKEKYIAKKVVYFRLSSFWKEKQDEKSLFESLNKAPKQRLFMLHYFNEVSKNKKDDIELKSFLKSNHLSNSIYKELISKNILEQVEIQTDRISFNDTPQPLNKLTLFQQKALQDIFLQFQKYSTVVLQGVVASGKTEIYIHLIKEFLQQGKQVLYLIPEIALATQLLLRLKEHFSEYISVYHSKYSSSERAELWNNLIENRKKAQLIIGVSNSVFLPFSNLGLVIVDQEHESSYKQTITSPRFQARDSALVLAKLHNAKVVLGSSTPCLETYYNIQKQKYGYVELTERYSQIPLPEISLIDIKDRKRRKVMKGYLSQELIDAISESLQRKEQVILFQNRRGYAPVLECNTCGSSEQCPNCDVTLTYHQYSNRLKCHYCGYTMVRPLVCFRCFSADLDAKGLGTEQIEYIVKEQFPEARVGRMDKETTRSKYGYEKILSQFENHQLDILVGTQMMVKGLDFSSVQLLGVIQTDSILHFPEFRAFERAYQLLTQAAGRTGRTNKQGKAIFQTYLQESELLNQIKKFDYKAMIFQQMQERETFDFPPFVRMIKIIFFHRNFQTINESSFWFSENLKSIFLQDVQVLGPEFSVIPRIKNQYIKSILLKIKPNCSLKNIKKEILRLGIKFSAIAQFRSVRIVYDVDPES